MICLLRLCWKACCFDFGVNVFAVAAIEISHLFCTTKGASRSFSWVFFCVPFCSSAEKPCYSRDDGSEFGGGTESSSLYCTGNKQPLYWCDNQ